MRWLALVVPVVIVGAALLIGRGHHADGPGADAALAARSLKAELVRRGHPATDDVVCGGTAPGFFGCEARTSASLPGVRIHDYSVMYDAARHVYTSRPSGSHTLVFAPLA